MVGVLWRIILSKMKIAVNMLALVLILICTSIEEISCQDDSETEDLQSVYSFFNNKTVNMCFFCDKHCRELIEERYSMEEFFKEIGDIITKNFHNSNLNLTIAIKDVYEFKKNINLEKYDNGKGGKDQLSVISKNFWEHKDFYKQMKAKYNCGVGYVLQPFNDAFWKTSSKEGISTMFGLCQEDGYGVVELNAEDVRATATLLSHELGHEMGMYHDDANLDPSVFAMDKNSQYKKYVEDILKWCGPDNDNGCKDIAGACIMNPAPNAFSPYPSMFSECSVAYLKYYITIPLSEYNHSCIY